MGQAREVMDRLTDALTAHQDIKVVGELYADDAVAFTPDEGEMAPGATTSSSTGGR
ncbi:hypothetical protein SALBM311S_11501 [Streptomyces alboniger]